MKKYSFLDIILGSLANDAGIYLNMEQREKLKEVFVYYGEAVMNDKSVQKEINDLCDEASTNSK